MDTFKRDILNNSRELIISDLHGDVFVSLQDKEVLTKEEYNSLISLDPQEKKNEQLLNILFDKNDGLEQLIDSLKEWYPWVEFELKESLKNVSSKKASWVEAVAENLIPALPRRNVSRKVLLSQLRAELRQLQKGHYVVLNGMSGCGKSTLASEALNHDLLIENFEGKVMWLSCGPEAYTGDENELLGLMIQLNERICNEDLVTDGKTVNLKTLKIKLHKRFYDSSFKEGLLVLDGVNSEEIIEALNIGCKTLVTTYDENVMNKQGNRYKTIKVSEGFTEEESLFHLASCVGLLVENLPSQAKQIHSLGKGHPLVMSLIGAHLEDQKEEARSNPKPWDSCLDVLINKDYGNLKRQSYGGVKVMPNTIDLCINNLAPEKQNKYQDFALFVEDVNIKTEVLEILWGLSSFEVAKLMDEFLTKSLVVRKYNTVKNYYVYAIHDLLLYHLKKPLEKEDKLKDLHLKLISRYEELCNGNLACLPKSDNYIWYYIGYHIANSRNYSLFLKWYFNLDFVEAKLKVTGLADLLTDYKRYGPLFTIGKSQDEASEILKQLSDFVRFVESYGVDVRKNHGPDIVQYALQEPHDSEVYKIAVSQVQRRPISAYLRFQLGPSENRSIPYTIQTKERVSSACFLQNNYVLVALESGNIEVMSKKGYVTRIYEGHSEKVTRLSVSLVKYIFLSVSENCVKVWHLPDLDSSVTVGPGNRTPSPSQRQQDFTDIFNHKTVEKRMSWITKNIKFVDWAAFSTSGLYMATCCSRKQLVQVWEISNKEPLPSRIRVSGTTCVFSNNDEFLIIGGSNSHIYIHNVMSNKSVNQLVDSYPILTLFALPGNSLEMKFGSLTRATLCVWEVENMTTRFVEQQNKNVPCLRDYSKGESECYVSCAAAPDGTIVAVATSTGKILICDLRDGAIVREINNLSGNIGYLAMDGSKEHVLLSCYNDTTIHLWTLGNIDSGKPATMKTNFDVAWTDNHTPILVAPTYKSCVKKIIEKTNHEDLLIPDNGEINVCAISKCGKYIAIGSSNTQVYLHCDISDFIIKKIFKVDKCPSKLKVDTSEGKIFVIAGLDRSFKIWVCEEEFLSCPEKKAEIFSVTLNDRLIDYFIIASEELLTVTKNGTIKKWSLCRGQQIEELCVSRFDVIICDCDINCHNTVVTLDSRRNRLNVYFSDKSVQSLELASQPSNCSFSADGNKLVVGFQNGYIQMWNVVSGSLTDCGRVQVMSNAVECICVSSGGLVGAAGKSRVVLGHLGSRMGQAKLRVERLVMSPDNTTVLTVDTDGHMHLIDLFGNVESLTSSVSSLSFESEK